MSIGYMIPETARGDETVSLSDKWLLGPFSILSLWLQKAAMAFKMECSEGWWGAGVPQQGSVPSPASHTGSDWLQQGYLQVGSLCPTLTCSRASENKNCGSIFVSYCVFQAFRVVTVLIKSNFFLPVSAFMLYSNFHFDGKGHANHFGTVYKENTLILCFPKGGRKCCD